MYVSEGGGERQRESGAGSRVKGGADPGGARGSQWQSGRWEGVVSGGGPGFNRDVRCDKDGPDRSAEWSCPDRAAILRIPYTAPLHCRHAPHSLLSHSCHLSCCINLFHLLVTMLRVSLMCQSLMCVSTFMSKHCLNSSHCGRKRYIITLFFSFIKMSPNEFHK